MTWHGNFPSVLQEDEEEADALYSNPQLITCLWFISSFRLLASLLISFDAIQNQPTTHFVNGEELEQTHRL